MTTSTAFRKPDKHDVRLLKICSDYEYRFTRGAGQEIRAHEMFVAGLLERRCQIYSVKAGGKRFEVRWAYRRTVAGKALVASFTLAATASGPGADAAAPPPREGEG